MIASLIGAGATLGASYLGNSISANSARKINEMNLQNQHDMYDKQIELANTAHQREVVDLRAAGLNPILSANGGGAAAPAAPSVDLTNPDASWAALGDQVNSASGHLGKGVDRQLQRQQIAAQVDSLRAGTDNTATAAARGKLQLEKEAMELAYWHRHPDQYERMLSLRTQPSSGVRAGIDFLERGKDGVVDAAREAWENGTQLLGDFFRAHGPVQTVPKVAGPREVTVGGETYIVPPSAPPRAIHERAVPMIRVKHDGTPKRKHN